MNEHKLKVRKEGGEYPRLLFTPGTGRDLDEEPAAEASKADNSPHYIQRQRAAGKGNKEMVQRPKLNSTCKMTSGQDLEGARKYMAEG